MTTETEELREKLLDAIKNPRDEYHTMEELYEYRMAYNALAFNLAHKQGWSVVKSIHHSDGELCFGGGWFIVVMETPHGQISNHYKMENFCWFDVPIVNLPPEYDGHTPQEALTRLFDFMFTLSMMDDNEE